MTLFVDDPDFQLHVGDVRDVLGDLADASVDCVVTSPPYWGLRDYGAAGQLGLEATPEAYVAAMVAVFAEVRRVLVDSGTLWLNLGDSYVSDPGKGGSGTPNGRNGRGEGYARERMAQTRDGEAVHGDVLRPYAVQGLAPKNLVGIPWRVALALQADGWYLRSDIIWSKPNPMPESVTDRPTKSHEYVFLLSRQPSYFFDQDAVREPWATTHAPGSAIRPTHHYAETNGGNDGLTGHLADVKARLRDASRPQAETLDGSDGEAPRGPDGRRQTGVQARDGSHQHRDGERWPDEGRNIRSVWTIPTQPYAGAHFATYPEELVRRCITAGCPAGGVVLDPFMGSGTTALVARKLGRRSVGIELNPEYARLCAARLQQLSLLA